MHFTGFCPSSFLYCHYPDETLEMPCPWHIPPTPSSARSVGISLASHFVQMTQAHTPEGTTSLVKPTHRACCLNTSCTLSSSLAKGLNVLLGKACSGFLSVVFPAVAAHRLLLYFTAGKKLVSFNTTDVLESAVKNCGFMPNKNSRKHFCLQ